LDFYFSLPLGTQARFYINRLPVIEAVPLQSPDLHSVVTISNIREMLKHSPGRAKAS
jgi:hypothetical protein